MNKLWQLWPASIAPEMVDRIIEVGERSPQGTGGIGFDGQTMNNNYRECQIKWIPPYENKDITDILWYFAQQANRNAFNFEISYLNDLQYTVYEGSDEAKYDWHCDTFWANPTCYDRKISIVIQLSDPSEYEGGLFEFDHQYEQPPQQNLMQRGSVLAFPSFLLHRVTPVTRGTRKSLVAWIEGPKFR